MAEYRNTRTDTWRDDWFMELTPHEKLAFFYLFTNESTNLAGIYKLSYRHMQLETGLDTETLNAALDHFVADRKVVIGDGYIWVVNLRKYNASRSPKADAAIESILKQIPDCDIKRAYIACYTQNIPYTYPIDTTLPSHNNTTQSNTTQYKEEKAALPPAQIAAEVYGPTDSFDSMKNAIESLIGYMIPPTQKEVDAISTMVAEGINSEDLNAAVAFFKDNRKVVRGAAHLLESARYNKAQRQQANAKAPPNGKYKGKQSLEDRNREVAAQVQKEIDDGTFSKY